MGATGGLGGGGLAPDGGALGLSGVFGVLPLADNKLPPPPAPPSAPRVPNPALRAM